MYHPLALYVGYRYTRAKRRNHFISFISLTSLIGIALGVMVLITVLSVMNGFDEQIRTRVFGMARQVTVSQQDQQIEHWQALEATVAKQPHIKAVAPFVNGQGMLLHGGPVRPVMVTGILPSEQGKVSVLGKKMLAGSLDALQPGKFGMVIGRQLAAMLGVNVGDKLILVTPHVSVNLAGVIPRMKRFTIVGTFDVGNGFGFGSGWAFINLQDAQRLYGLGQAITGLQLKLDNLYLAPSVSQQLSKTLPESYWVSDWTRDYGSFFHAIAMEKTMMFLILLLLIAVAAFNLVSTLVMVVTDKQADIAILRTLGASPRLILSIFMVQGSLVGVIGTFLGLIAGIALSLHVTEIVSALQTVFHLDLFASDVYWVDYLPSRLAVGDVVRVCFAALLMSFLATLYPAWRASKVQPAKALRYE